MSQNETERTLHARFEGGAVYTQEVNNQFLVIINQAALLDLLDESDCEQLSEIRVKKLYVLARWRNAIYISIGVLITFNLLIRIKLATEALI